MKGRTIVLQRNISYAFKLIKKINVKPKLIQSRISISGLTSKLKGLWPEESRT